MRGLRALRACFWKNTRIGICLAYLVSIAKPAIAAVVQNMNIFTVSMRGVLSSLGRCVASRRVAVTAAITNYSIRTYLILKKR